MLIVCVKIVAPIICTFWQFALWSTDLTILCQANPRTLMFLCYVVFNGKLHYKWHSTKTLTFRRSHSGVMGLFWDYSRTGYLLCLPYLARRVKRYMILVAFSRYYGLANHNYATCQIVCTKHRRAMYQRAETIFYIYHTLKVVFLVKINVILLRFCLAWPFCTYADYRCYMVSATKNKFKKFFWQKHFFPILLQALTM